MGVWYSLVNQSRRELIYFDRLPVKTIREITGSSVGAAMVSWYLFKHPGDRIAFVAEEENKWPFPEGSLEDLPHYHEVTAEVVEALLAEGILQDEGREYIDDDDPDIWLRRLRNIWDSPPPFDEKYPPVARMPCAGCGRLLHAGAECPVCNGELRPVRAFVPVPPGPQAGQGWSGQKLVPLGFEDLLAGWLVTLGFGGAAVWSSWNNGRVPSLLGLRPLATHTDLVWIYFVALTLVMLVLSRRAARGIRRDTLLMLVGAFAGGAMLTALVFTPFFGLTILVRQLYAVAARE